MIEDVEIITGGLQEDERGSVKFVNDFNLDSIKRFYLIKQNKNSVARAWQGHKVEEKYFYVITGSFLVCAVRVDNWDNPSSNLPVKKYVLAEDDNNVLHIPGGYANGISALEDNSKAIVFSSLSLAESAKDDYRYPKSLWLDWDHPSND